MILIADSGSSKTSWYFSYSIDDSKQITTKGINPFFRTSEEIYFELKKNLAPKISTGIKQIYFYGAGIINTEKGNVVKDAIQKLFPDAKIEVRSDLLAAARATLQNKTGIACILGTGSNSCLYNGNSISKQVPPLGFILGDEGSGAVLGRKLTADFLKGIMPAHLSAKFRKNYSMSYANFLEHVYRKEKPNKFLAQFVPFLSENINDEYCSQLVEKSFGEFFERNIMQYKNYRNYEICFIGSVAYNFQNQLKKILEKKDLKPGIILKEPLNGLIRFHLIK